MNKNKFLIIIQARLGSTRLPNKVLLPLYNNKSILDFVVQRLKKNVPGINIVLATGKNRENDALIKWADNNGIKSFVGDENDVTTRFVSCIDEQGFEGKIIRICADNPFLDMGLLNGQVEYADKVNSNYYSYKVFETPAILTHYGCFGEIVDSNSLRKVTELTGDLFYREHVTKFIYEHPAEFNIEWLDVSRQFANYKGIRLTIDTAKDFEHAQVILNQLGAKADEMNYDYNDVFSLVNTNEEMHKAMTELINNTKK